ncbi:MAG: SpvB/TcaC N-terminal domain-containing protein, partial [bacterium]
MISPFATQAAGPATQQKSEVPELEAGVDTNTGVLTHAIEIDVPPGPGGLEPGLALVYSSRARAGVAGFGWGLQTDQIQCSERLGAPDHTACADFE